MSINSPEPTSVTPPPPRTVLSILAAHAEELSVVTGGRLVGNLTTGKTFTGDFDHALSVCVPTLRDARLLLVEVQHGADLASIRMNIHVPKCSLVLHGLDELDAALERVLLSVEVTERLQTLLVRTIH